MMRFGDLAESCTLTGAIAFEWLRKLHRFEYAIERHVRFRPDRNGIGYCASLGAGTYGVQSNGMLQMDNPLYPATLFGTFSQPVVIASSTEDDYFDLFIAVQAPPECVTNSSFSGHVHRGYAGISRAPR